MELILIGGTTGTGKSPIGHQIAANIGASYLEGDALRQALQHGSPPDDPVNVFVTRSPTEYLSWDPAALCDAQTRVSEETCARAFRPALERTDSRAVLLEGDDLTPAFVMELRHHDEMRAIFALELDPRMPMARTKAPGGISEAQREAFAGVHRCRAERMSAEAAAASIPLVPPRDAAAWLASLGLAT